VGSQYPDERGKGQHVARVMTTIESEHFSGEGCGQGVTPLELGRIKDAGGNPRHQF